jgi:hypothetical protein
VPRKDPEARREYERARYLRRKEQQREYSRQPAVRDRMRAREAERRYNMTEAGRARARAYSRKSARRGLGILNPTGETRTGTCQICLRENVQLVCDHDHTTGLVRGWPCGNCNRAAGMIGDTLESARRLVAYFETPV